MMNSMPSRKDLIDKIDLLCSAKETREQVAQWASSLLNSDFQVRDRIAWSVLEGLGAADLPSTDREYLYSVRDFNEWRSMLISDDQ